MNRQRRVVLWISSVAAAAVVGMGTYVANGAHPLASVLLFAAMLMLALLPWIIPPQE